MIIRHKFLTHRIQFKLASVFVLWFVVFLAVFAFIYFFNFVEIANKTDSFTFHDRLVAKSLLVDQAYEMGVWFGAALAGFVILVWAYLLVYSNRLTGPVHKIEMLLQKATADKNLMTTNLTFRKEDAFHKLAECLNEYNQMIEKEHLSKSKNKIA